MSRRMQTAPMMVVDEDAKRVSDGDAQEHNIRAARAVAEAVRSTLGPRGMDKMLVDSLGDITVTNDGATILQEMEIDNPIAEMIVGVAETQEHEVGDGTTTAVTLAGELLSTAEDLIEQDVHPTVIIRGFDLAVDRAREAIEQISIDVGPDDEDVLKRIAETGLTGKRGGVNRDVIAELVVNAAGSVSVSTDDGGTVANIDEINIRTKTGEVVENSTLVDGVVIEKDPASDRMPTELDDAKILLLEQAIEIEEGDSDPEIVLENREQLDTFLDWEDERLGEVVQKIADSGADAVFCLNQIDQRARHLLASEGILGVKRIDEDDADALANAVGANYVRDIDAVTPDDLGRGSISRASADVPHNLIGNFHVEGTDARTRTLLLFGSTDHVVDELERDITDALNVVVQAINDGRVVGGGGAPEIEVASHVRDYADGVGGREQLAVEAFADAVEVVPRVIASNAGLDPIDTLADLRSAHARGDVHHGIDVDAAEVVDTHAAGVMEPSTVKRQALSSAVEAASLILKIDDLIVSEQDEDAGNDIP